MVKEIKRHNLELENEIIRKEREEKKQKEEFIKLQVKHEDLQVNLNFIFLQSTYFDRIQIRCIFQVEIRMTPNLIDCMAN